MNAPLQKGWDGIERRKPNSCRRSSERRSSQERRHDRRKDGAPQNRRGVYKWFRSVVKGRLGVDRRQYVDQRKIADRRFTTTRSMLTKEELSELLS